MNFPQDHIAANISNKLMDLRLEFGVYHKSSDGKPLQSLHAVRVDKLVYFQLEPIIYKAVFTIDCGSDVSVGAERNNLWDWNRCACHCLNIAIQVALKEEVIQQCLALLTALAHRFSKSRSTWNKFKKAQMEILDREEECNEDEGEANCDGDEDFVVGGEGQPRLKKVLQLIRPVPTCWNSTYYLVKRALALKEAVVQFMNFQRSRPSEHPATIPMDDNVEVFIWSYSCTMTPTHPYYARKLCSHRLMQSGLQLSGDAPHRLGTPQHGSQMRCGSKTKYIT